MPEDYWPPPCFEYVDLWQYSDKEIHDYIMTLCDFMNNRTKHIKDLQSNPEVVKQEMSVEDIPF